jgi:hypothetical protein
MQALIAHGNQNPRKPAGPLSAVVRELCDVILTAAVALRCAAGPDARDVFAQHAQAVLDRIQQTTPASQTEPHDEHATGTPERTP